MKQKKQKEAKKRTVLIDLAKREVGEDDENEIDDEMDRRQDKINGNITVDIDTR